MGTKVKETCTVLNQECIGKDIYSMWIQTKTIAGNAKPGQFVSVYTQDGMPSAQWEVTVAVMENGYEILTH